MRKEKKIKEMQVPLKCQNFKIILMSLLLKSFIFISKFCKYTCKYLRNGSCSPHILQWLTNSPTTTH